MSMIIFVALLSVFMLCLGAPDCVNGSCPGPRTAGPKLLQGRSTKRFTETAAACEYDRSLDPQSNLLKALAEKTEGVEYTAEEMLNFTTRAEQALKDILEGEGLRLFIKDFDAYMEGIADLLRPCVTQAMIDTVNSAGVDWVAAKTEETTLMTMGEFRGRLGTVLQPPTAASLLHAGTRQTHPDEFDPSVHWANCAGVFAHIRDQGNCGSCWAMAAASSIESRLCIATQGQFQGYISGGYITSCNPPPARFGEPDGCGGGYTDAGYDLANNGGIPTGTNNVQPVDGCVPYFGSGSYEDHWNSHAGAPACPGSCTNPDYTTPLLADRYVGTGEASEKSSSQSWAKEKLLESGPLVMAYTVYDDFMAYKRGIYKYTYGSKAGGHAVMCSGWGKESDKPYLQCSNSWGTNWGESGRFRIKWGECDMYFEAGKMAAAQPALNPSPAPAPGPGDVTTPTPAPTSAPTTGEEPACCGDSCATSSDCGAKLFCCPNHNICMDRMTGSTRGRNCRKC